MSKRVCHITSAHGRYDVRIFIKQCQSLARNGYDVTLLVNDDKNDETLEGVKIVSTRYTPRARMDRFIYSKNNLLGKALAIDADVYQLHDPDLLPLGAKLKRLGKKVIFDSHEDVPQQIKDKRWIPGPLRNLIAFIYGIYEMYTVKKLDAVISVTPHIVERFRGINDNAVLVTNYPIVDNNEITDKNPEKAICFAGGVTRQYRHYNILRAIQDIDNVKYILAGPATKSYLGFLKGVSSWGKVEYKGVIPHWQVQNIYSRSIAGVAIHKSTQAGKIGSLGGVKLFEFMSAGLPVICTDYILWKRIIDKYKCGIC